MTSDKQRDEERQQTNKQTRTTNIMISQNRQNRHPNEHGLASRCVTQVSVWPTPRSVGSKTIFPHGCGQWKAKSIPLWARNVSFPPSKTHPAQPGRREKEQNTKIAQIWLIDKKVISTLAKLKEKESKIWGRRRHR